MSRINLSRLARGAVVVATAAAAMQYAEPSPAAALSLPWDARVGHPTAPACGAGQVAVMPTSAVGDAFGIVHVTYSQFPDLTTAVISPDALTAAPTPGLLDDVKTSGLRPADLVHSSTPAVAQALCMSGRSLDPNWTPVAGPAQHSATDAQASAATTQDGPGPNTHYSTTNWAGAQVSGTFTGVYGQWTVQQSIVGPPAPNQDTTWIGVGGGHGDAIGSIIQAGTDISSGGGYRNWFEIFGAGAACNGNNAPSYSSCGGVTFVSPNYLRPGDAIWSQVYWTSQTRACFVLDDTSRASGGLSGCVSNVGVKYDTNTIEWIDEGHYWNQQGIATGDHLADFGQTHWTQADSYNPSTGAYQYYSDYPYASNVMNDPGTAGTSCGVAGTMAYPAGAGNGNSTTYWCKDD